MTITLHFSWLKGRTCFLSSIIDWFGFYFKLLGVVYISNLENYSFISSVLYLPKFYLSYVCPNTHMFVCVICQIREGSIISAVEA